MDSKIAKILKKLEDNGFEAYIVGGYVRDYLLGNLSTDVDICTNALPKDVIKIFDIKKDTTLYGSLSFKEGIYNFDITTYRAESNYDKRKPQTIEYVNNLLTDIKRRDFTINSLCMNSNGDVIDLLNGKEDINNKKIKVIGSTMEKLTEDPLRMLRAIRFSVLLDFEIDENIILFIHNHKDLIKSLSYNRKKEELERILSSKNVKYGLDLLKELDLLDALEINYDKIVVVPDILGIWAQIKFSSNYPFTRSSLNTIKDIRDIVSSGEVDSYTLYNYELYVSLVAGEILGISKEEINLKYHNLPIHNKSELAINSLDIINILNIEPSKKVKVIFKDIIVKVVNDELQNDKEKIKEYILKNWK